MTARAARRLALVTALGLLAPAAGVRAQGRQSPDVALQAAVHTELVEGNLERAIQLYRNIATNHAANRAVAANALVYMGRAYEKLGRAEARRAYERVVQEYADQAEPARIARARLQTIYAARNDRAERSSEPTLRLVLGDLNMMPRLAAAPFDFSPRGDRVVFVLNHPRGVGGDTLPVRRLYIADQSGTLVRPLLRDADAWQWYSFPQWSPDGKYIAYGAARNANYIAAHNLSPDTVRAAAFVLDPDEGTPRRVTLGDVPQTLGRFMQNSPMMWTPDGRRLTFVFRNGLHTVELDGNTVSTVPVEHRQRTEYGGYSPDGRWLVFHVVNEGSQQAGETDVWILPAAGGRALQITRAPGFDGFPTWSRDGRAIYFVSDRGGDPNIFRQPLDPQTGVVQGDAEQVTFYTDAVVKAPRMLSDGRMAFGLMRFNPAIHVAPTARPEQRRTLARGFGPQLSPDGRTVFYEGGGAEEEGIWSVPLEGGSPRRLTSMRPAARYGRVFHVSPDGRTVAFFSRVGDGTVLFTVPTAGGEPRQLLRLGTREFLAPSWSRDGSLIAYTTGNGLYVMPGTGGASRRLASLHGWEGWTVRWSPDGRWISALGYTAPREENAVFVVPASGGDPRRLTPPEENEYKEGLEWHPSGQRLTYMYYQGGGGDDTRQVSLDGGPTTLLVNQPEPMWDYVGTWAPDGREYYFISTPRGSGNQWGLFAFDEASGRTRVISPAVSPEQGSAGVPSFSRDGQTMVWTTTRTVGQVWLMENVR